MSTSGGATWKELDKSLDDGYALAVGSLYQAGCAVDQQSTNRGMAVSKSDDNGKTWRKTVLSKDYGYIKAIAVHPRNKQLVFAGGERITNRVAQSALFGSTDGGTTWSEITALSGKGSCVYGICFDPAEPGRLLVATDKGVFVSDDEGKNWSAPQQVVASTCILGDPGVKGRFFIGSKQGAWVSADGGKSWKEINENIPSRSIACLAFDQKNSILYAGGATGGVMRLKLNQAQVSSVTK